MVSGEIHADGSIWSPAQCSQCKCKNGKVMCFVTQCPLMVCPANHTLELTSGSCCPQCMGNPCVWNSEVHEVFLSFSFN